MQVTSEYQQQEDRRLVLQAQLDGVKTPEDRNRLGQFATPSALANDLLSYAGTLLPLESAVRFLDPAFGTGSFFSALLRAFPAGRIKSAIAYEIDAHYGVPAMALWQDSPLQLHIADFTQAVPPTCDSEKANLIICNPPYVRHHHLLAAEKARLQTEAQRIAGTTISKLAGLYAYFLLLSHAWLAEDGIAGWLIPSEFMDVNYGRNVKHYLLHSVTLLRIHRFEPTDVQFTDALVSSTVVWLRHAAPPPDHVVEFTYGGTLAAPHLTKHIPVHVLERTPKWTSLSVGETHDPSLRVEREPTLADFFSIKRGLATGENKFFILTPEQVTQLELPDEFLRPILPSARYLPNDIIHADAHGEPVGIRKLYLLSCDLPEADIQQQYPSLWRYLEHGKHAGVCESYLCRHRRPWYAQEQRPPAPFLCTYMGRPGAQNANPFRFILNYSKATAANTYHLLYPKPHVAAVLADDPARLHVVWQAMNAITATAMKSGGRVYGGGLHKVEPKELANIPAHSIVAALAPFAAPHM